MATTFEGLKHVLKHRIQGLIVQFNHRRVKAYYLIAF